MEIQAIQAVETKPEPKVRVDCWELYNSTAGYRAAERDLSRTGVRAEAELLKKLGKAKLKDGDGVVLTLIGEVFKKHFEPKLTKYREYGAWDTEPRDHAKAWLRDAACEFLGWEKHEVSLWDL